MGSSIHDYGHPMAVGHLHYCFQRQRGIAPKKDDIKHGSRCRGNGCFQLFHSRSGVRCTDIAHFCADSRAAAVIHVALGGLHDNLVPRAGDLRQAMENFFIVPRQGGSGGNHHASRRAVGNISTFVMGQFCQGIAGFGLNFGQFHTAGCNLPHGPQAGRRHAAGTISGKRILRVDIALIFQKFFHRSSQRIVPEKPVVVAGGFVPSQGAIHRLQGIAQA